MKKICIAIKILYYIQKLYAGQIEEAENFRQQFNVQK